METILIPTDFSDVAKNAADYAMEVAKQTKAKIILLHIFQIPVVATDMPVIITPLEEIEKDSMLMLNNYKKELIEKYGNYVPVECIARPGFIIDEIKYLSIERNIGLIIMGLTGGGKFEEIVMGSNATGVIQKVSCPTLIVPKNAKFKEIKRLAFACDLADFSESAALSQLRLFLQLFDAKLLIFNVVEPQKELSYAASVNEEKISTFFQNIDHSIYFPENEDLEFAINDFVDKHHVDILAMHSKKHGFVTRMFRESKTKKMAFQAHIPLLAVHD